MNFTIHLIVMNIQTTSPSLGKHNTSEIYDDGDKACRSMNSDGILDPKFNDS